MTRTESGYRWALRTMGVKGDNLDATALLEEVREAEREQRDELGVDYPSSQVRQAVVHGREDIVILVSLLGSLNRSARKICNRLNVLIFLGIAAVVLLWV